MPAPKRMIRGSGDLPRNPAHLKKTKDGDEPTQEATQLELVPKQAVAPPGAPAPTQGSEGIIITVKSCNLKESKGRGREGKPPIYRSVTGKDAEGKTYWFPVEMESANPQVGEQWEVQGNERKSFGSQKNPLHPIDVTSFKRVEENPADYSNVSSVSSDTLVHTLTTLVKEHGNYAVLRALAEASK